MSLINQVLNDLESRGASVPPILDEAIRPVIVEKKDVNRNLLIGLVLVLLLAAAAWLAQKLKQPVEPVVSAVVENSLVPEKITAATPLPVEPPENNSKPVSRQSVGLSATPKTTTVAKQNEGKIAPKQVGAQVVTEQKLNTGAQDESASPSGKQFKKLTLQQQAENEFHKATLLVQQGQLKDAAAGYEAALLITPLYDKAREALVAVLLTSKLNAEAEKVLQEGLLLNVKQTRFAMLLARLQLERKAQSQALQTLELSLPYAEQADYHAFIAALFQRQDKHLDAVSQYQTALQLSPNSGVWLMGMGISLQALKRDEEARASYKRAIDTRSLSAALQSFVEQRLADIK